MSYREENDQVILTMSRDDFEFLLMFARVGVDREGSQWARELLDRLNDGNPHYTPYQVKP